MRPMINERELTSYKVRVLPWKVWWYLSEWILSFNAYYWCLILLT